jgi:hypothetical protein
MRFPTAPTILLPAAFPVSLVRLAHLDSQTTSYRAREHVIWSLHRRRYWISWIKSSRTGFRPGNPRLSGKDIRNISIITARNSQKDALNKMGTERFAKDSKQVLHIFIFILSTGWALVQWISRNGKRACSLRSRKCQNLFNPYCGMQLLQLQMNLCQESYPYVWVCWSYWERTMLLNYALQRAKSL